MLCPWGKQVSDPGFAPGPLPWALPRPRLWTGSALEHALEAVAPRHLAVQFLYNDALRAPLRPCKPRRGGLALGRPLCRNLGVL